MFGGQGRGSAREIHLAYVDNYVVLETSEEQVDALASTGVNALRSKGLVVHEEEKSSGAGKMLGWEFEQARLRPMRHRVWRVILALRRVLQTGVASQLEKILGHATFIALGESATSSLHLFAALFAAK